MRRVAGEEEDTEEELTIQGRTSSVCLLLHHCGLAGAASSRRRRRRSPFVPSPSRTRSPRVDGSLFLLYIEMKVGVELGVGTRRE